MTLRPVNNPAAGVAPADADGLALFRNEPPRSRVCALAPTGQNCLSEGHCPCRAGAWIRKSGYRFSSTSDISRMYIFVPASAGVIIQTLTSRRGYETTESLKTAAMKRSIELLGTEVAPIVRAAESKR